MKRRVIACAIALLAGCEHTPKQLAEEGERTVHALSQPPELAAACMARNLENERFSTAPAVRRLDKDGRYELVAPFSPATTLLVAHLEPRNGGSRATLWLRPHWFYRRDQVIPTALKGC